jgi:hypothetical protein
MFPLTPTLRAVLERQRDRTEAVAVATGRIITWGTPPKRSADQELPAGVAHGVRERRAPGKDSP